MVERLIENPHRRNLAQIDQRRQGEACGQQQGEESRAQHWPESWRWQSSALTIDQNLGDRRLRNQPGRATKDNGDQRQPKQHQTQRAHDFGRRCSKGLQERDQIALIEPKRVALTDAPQGADRISGVDQGRHAQESAAPGSVTAPVPVDRRHRLP